MGNKNSQTAVSLTAIGERLKSAREKKGTTIEQAERQTHIHSTVLAALEAGRVDEVLTPNYVKSFLKKYASYLGVDHNQVVAEYSSIHPELESPNLNLGMEKSVIRPRADTGRYLRFVWKTAIIAICVFVLFILFRAATRIIATHNKPSARKVSVPVKKNVSTIPARKAPVPANKTQQKQPESPQITQVVIPQNEPISLNMKVNEQVYVGVKRDGMLLFKRLLPKGAVETFSAEEKLNISIGKAKAVELSLNGRPLGPIGKGSIADLEITRKSIRIK